MNKDWKEKFKELNPDLEIISQVESKGKIFTINIYHKELDSFLILDFNKDPLELTKAINKKIENNIEKLENYLKLYKKVLKRRKEIVNRRKNEGK